LIVNGKMDSPAAQEIAVLHLPGTEIAAIFPPAFIWLRWRCGFDCALTVQKDGLFNTVGARLGIGADIAQREDDAKHCASKK